MGLPSIEISVEAVQYWSSMVKHQAKRAAADFVREECQILDAVGVQVMSKRLLEAGEVVSEEEIMGAVLSLRRAVTSQGGWRDSDYIYSGKSRKFWLWRDLGGAGIVDTETSGGMKISLESHLLEGTRLIQAKIPGTLDSGWDPHDTPAGGAALTTVRMTGFSGQNAWQRHGFVWKESHYSFGRRWDPSSDTAAVNYYFESGGLKCRQRFTQGESCTVGDVPVFEGFYPDGTLRAVEYGVGRGGRHRPVNLGPAYQEFHPNGSPALIVFAENGVQKGKALRFSPSGDKIEHGKESIGCGFITIGEEWALRDETSENHRGLGEALIEAVRTGSGLRLGKKSRSLGGRGR